MTRNRNIKHGIVAMSKSADSSFIETIQEAPFASLGMSELVEPPESIKTVLNWQRTLVKIVSSAIWTALRLGMVLALLLGPFGATLGALDQVLGRSLALLDRSRY